MGFEARFERGIRHPIWGKSIFLFKNASEDDDRWPLHRSIYKAIAKESRSGKYAVLADLVNAYRGALSTARDSANLLVLFPDANQLNIIGLFDRYIRSAVIASGGNLAIEMFADIAYESLLSELSEDNTSESNIERAVDGLCIEFVQRYVRSQLEPAVELKVAGRQESPYRVMDALHAVVNSMKLDTIVKNLSRGEPILRAPVVKSEASEKVLATSVLR